MMKFLYMSSSSELPITGKVSLGLTLAGASSEAVQAKIALQIKNKLKFVDRIVVDTDAVAPVFMGLRKGTVLISGTGSSCLFISDKGIEKRSGGLGHMLGDEGSAYWIATKAIKLVLDKADGIPNNVLDTTLVEAEIKKYFKVEKLNDLVKVFHENFDKAKIAGFAERLAITANDKDDPGNEKLFVFGSIRYFSCENLLLFCWLRIG